MSLYYVEKKTIYFFFKFCINDPSQTFWDDPKMYVDDPGLDTLLSLTADELLPCNDQDDVTVSCDECDESSIRQNIKEIQKPKQQDKLNEVKHVLECTYPNCDKTYLKPSHLKVNFQRFVFIFVLYHDLIFCEIDF